MKCNATFCLRGLRTLLYQDDKMWHVPLIIQISLALEFDVLLTNTGSGYLML